MFAPRTRVTVAPLIGGATSRGQVVARVDNVGPFASHRDVEKVNDSGAYLVRLSSGRRIVVAESQLNLASGELSSPTQHNER